MRLKNLSFSNKLKTKFSVAKHRMNAAHHLGKVLFFRKKKELKKNNNRKNIFTFGC